MSVQCFCGSWDHEPYQHLPDDELFWCDVCKTNDDTPHTPIDHPWLLKGHRLIPKPKVDEMMARYRRIEEAARAVDEADAVLVKATEEGGDDDLDEASARYADAIDALRSALG